MIAHELGHIKCEHGVWTTAANGLALGLYNLGGVVGQALAMQVQGEGRYSIMGGRHAERGEA